MKNLTSFSVGFNAIYDNSAVAYFLGHHVHYNSYLDRLSVRYTWYFVELQIYAHLFLWFTGNELYSMWDIMYTICWTPPLSVFIWYTRG